MRTTVFILIVLTLLSCDSDKIEGDAYNLNIGMRFSVKDQEGNDLLDPQNPDAYDKTGIKLYYLTDGEVVEAFEGRLDHPRFYSIEQDLSGAYYIHITPNHSEKEEFPVTYIEWKRRGGKTDVDTLQVEFMRTDAVGYFGGSIIQKRIWLNGALLWTDADRVEPNFELIK